jgi:hypothetical protein
LAGRNIKIMHQLASWPRGVYACGVRWNHCVSAEEARRMQQDVPWSKHEVRGEAPVCLVLSLICCTFLLVSSDKACVLSFVMRCFLVDRDVNQ